MSFTADLHLHSPYSYACSKAITLEGMASWAKIKGIDLLTSADFTHPLWLEGLRGNLRPDDGGLYEYNGVKFVLGTEVSCVFKQQGRSRRVHILLFAPDFETVDRINYALARRGCKLGGDGRPTLSLSARDLVLLALDANQDCLIIPAHVWTPWYGIFGSKSGFDGLEEAFLDAAPHILAVETGLSSDPAMNWTIPELRNKTIVSFSDAHSLPNLGRELTVFQGEPSYLGLARALSQQLVEYTVEFYPEEGKYHYDGHRKCGVCQSPGETAETGGRCPVCGRPLTRGVLSRISALAGEGIASLPAQKGSVRSPQGRPPFIRLVPLLELLSQSMGKGRTAKGVQAIYHALTQELGSELQVLASAQPADLEKIAGEEVAQVILDARAGNVVVEPGYDGRYGRVRTERRDPET